MSASETDQLYEATRWHVTIGIDPPVKELLDELLATGLFGRSREDIVERLLCERLRDILRDKP